MTLQGTLVRGAWGIGQRCMGHWSKVHGTLVKSAWAIGQRCMGHWSGAGDIGQGSMGPDLQVRV